MSINFSKIKAIPLMAYRHTFLFLAIISLITAFAIYQTKNLNIDANLTALLPDKFDSVQDLEQVKERFGGVGFIVITASNTNPEMMRQFADDVAERMQRLNLVSYVDYRRQSEFFRDRALYFLETSDLKTIHKRIKKRYKYEKNQRNPMYVDLEKTEPPSLDFTDIKDKYSDKNGKNSTWLSKQQSLESYYFNDDKSLIAIFIKPNMTSSDLDFTKEALAQVNQQLNQMDLKQYGPNIKIEFAGRYQKLIDLQNQMQTDLGIASLVSMMLVIGYLLVHFKRIEALVLILFPILIGLACTFGFAAMIFGQLNILTAFIGVILLGLGIDHGIHLLSRYRDEKNRSQDDTNTIVNTFSSTGSAVTLAAFTTFIIFVGLGLSDFRAFNEFGIIAAAGMVLIVISYMLVLPPLLKLTNILPWKLHTENKKLGDITGFYDKHGNKIIIGGIVIFLIVSFNSSNLNFNYDLDSLGNSEIRSFQLDREVSDLLGYAQTPLVALTDNKSEESHVIKTLRDNRRELGEQSGLDFLISTTDLVPIDQQDKHKLLKKINKILNKVKPSWLEEDDLELLEELKNQTTQKPFDYASLPEITLQLFGVKNPKNANLDEGVIILFPSVSLADGENVIRLADEVRSVNQTSGDRVVIAGEPLLLADILNLVFTEAPKILFISAIFILGIMWFFIKDLSYTLICLIPAIFTIMLTLGTMAIFGIELNYINMLMIPILLGISVDSGIHMVTRAMEGDRLANIINETGMAIFGSILTSGLGIGALLLTHHNGLNSLAYVGIIGLSFNLLVSIVFLPALLDRKLKNSGSINYKPIA